MNFTTKMLAVFAAMLVLSAFAVAPHSQGKAVFKLSPVGDASADALSDGVNNSMESYVPILLTVIFVVLIIGAIFMLKRRS